MEPVVELGRSNQNNLGVERDGLRVERAGWSAAACGRIVGVNVLRHQRPLQRLPCAGLSEQILGPENQIAAIGCVQRAGSDQGEIRDHAAPSSGFMFDSPQQPRNAGVVFRHHRRSLAPVVAGDQVHLIAPQKHGPAFSSLRILVIFAGRPEQRCMLEDILVDFVKICADLIFFRVSSLELAKSPIHHRPAHAADQFLHLPLGLDFQRLNLTNRVFNNLMFEGVDLVLQILLGLLWKLGQRFRRDGLTAFIDGQDLQSSRREDHGHARLLGLRLQISQALVACGFHVMLNVMDGRPEFVSVEGLRQIGPQIFDQGLHSLT